MEFKESKFERKEEMPFEADLRIDFIRHGKPVYSAEERQTGNFEGELTSEGKEQISFSAENIAKNIDKEKEIIVIWSSPKKRTRETSEIIKAALDKQGIPLIEPQIKLKKSLRDVQITRALIEDMTRNGVLSDWMEYWVKNRELPSGVESPEEVSKRVNRVITYMERIARKVEPKDGKKLHFVCVGHEELFKDFLEKGYGLEPKRTSGPAYGEVLRIDIHKSEPSKDAVLDLSYRDKKTKLGFDKDKRELYKQESNSSRL